MLFRSSETKAQDLLNSLAEQSIDQIPLSNRYSSLEVEAPIATVKNVKSEKPPPIYLRESSNNELVEKIKSLTDSKFYITSLKRGKINETKIQPFESDGFREPS